MCSAPPGFCNHLSPLEEMNLARMPDQPFRRASSNPLKSDVSQQEQALSKQDFQIWMFPGYNEGRRVLSKFSFRVKAATSVNIWAENGRWIRDAHCNRRICGAFYLSSWLEYH